ncbi:SDR family oxidoreductase [Streptomyces luteireticuli]|uniref:SDR family oxidoreductase n=1 Tax=Streptomyces luteireticuli TaxID=173858 RepID=A0ABN0YX13_9ACTN
MTVLITGGTGFLGLHLVRELLTRHRSLILLVRPGSPPALPRIHRFLAHGGTPESELRMLESRLEFVTADVTLPRLGLDETAFHRLADGIGMLWHCAADISLNPADPGVHTRNTGGMRRILELLEAAGPGALLGHASTLAVAGARRDGRVPEAPLDGASGFNSPYEESKFLCELLIQDWCARHGRAAAVFRLPALITAAPSYPGRPAHPLAIAAALGRTVPPAAPGSPVSVARLRLPDTHEDALVNFLPVEHVAHVMTETLEREHPSRARVYQIAHPRGTPGTTVTRVLARHLGGGTALTLGPGPATTPAEQLLQRAWAGFLPLLATTRRYEITRLTALGLAWPADDLLGEAYLTASLA